MKKVDGPHCILCSNPVEGVVEDRIHFTLFCPLLGQIREVYFRKFEQINPHINAIRSNQQQFLISLLDPFSPKVSEEVRQGWINPDIPYEISRNYFYAIHNKRKKLIEIFEKEVHGDVIEEPDTKLIFSIYSKQF